MAARPLDRIGPNSIIQTVAVLAARYGDTATNTLLATIGLPYRTDEPPTEMVSEAAFHMLVQAMLQRYGAAETDALLYTAGDWTGSYLLSHRIPHFFQRLLHLLPPRPALWLLLQAVRLHAWTFVGSGTFHFTIDRQPTIQIFVSYPSVTPVASFYAGTFDRLLHTLIDPQLTLQMSTSHQQTGAVDCRYDLLFAH